MKPLVCLNAIKSRPLGEGGGQKAVAKRKMKKMGSRVNSELRKFSRAGAFASKAFDMKLGARRSELGELVLEKLKR
jgi:hypothetical protein